MLTKKQRDLLIFIHERMVGGDIAPSFEEMKDALHLKSKSGIHRLIGALVERGYLERLPHRARALAVRRLPEGYMPVGADQSRPANTVRELNSLRSATIVDRGQTNDQNRDGIFEIPHLGKIAAGTPIEAIRHEGQMVDIPASLIGAGFGAKGGNNQHYALTVEGDSMIKAGIFDHDLVVIKRCETAENGAIIVALVDQQEVTLKRLRRAGNKIVLEPENDAYEPRILEPERVQIQGQLMSLIRSY